MLLLKRCFSNQVRISKVQKLKKPGDTLDVQGWIQNIRRLKNNIFLDVSDGSTSRRFQVVIPKNEETKDISAGSSIQASGRIQVAPNGNYELHAESVHVIANGHLTEGFPFTPKQQHAPEYVREYLHLRPRVDFIASMLRLRHRALKAIHDFMDENDFLQIQTPILTANDCEGAGELFAVRPDSEELLQTMKREGIPLEHSYFDNKVFLSVSGQLHLEAMCYGLGNVYTISPAFRAENSRSPLHLAEFYMYEAELAFMQHMSSLTAFMERMLKSVTLAVLETAEENLHTCQKKALGSSFPLTWLQSSWTTLSYDMAMDIVLANSDRFATEVKAAEGFSKEQEIFLVEHCGTPVFLVDWPVELKPFYALISRENPQRVHAVDLLMPTVGELCGGSLREWELERLQQHPHFPKGCLNWYTDLRKYGGMPTGGFGMGFERYLQLLTGIKNIRDVIPFPRYPHSCQM